MFEEYLIDAREFYDIAKKAKQQGEIREAQRYYRAAVFYTASALEAFVNYVAQGFELTPSFPPHEAAFLNDRELVFDPRKGELVERVRYYAIEDKVRFLIRQFNPNYSLGTSKEWSRFLEFKEFRDGLIHPRQSDDDTSVERYDEILRDGLSCIISLMNVMAKGIYKRPLRKKVLDLVPDPS